MNQFCMTFGKMSDIYVNWIIIFNVIDSIFHSSSIVKKNNTACLGLPKNLNIVKSLIIIKNNSPRTSTYTLKKTINSHDLGACCTWVCLQASLNKQLKTPKRKKKIKKIEAHLMAFLEAIRLRLHVLILCIFTPSLLSIFAFISHSFLARDLWNQFFFSSVGRTLYIIVIRRLEWKKSKSYPKLCMLAWCIHVSKTKFVWSGARKIHIFLIL